MPTWCDTAQTNRSTADPMEHCCVDCDDLLMAVAANMHLTFGDTAGSEPATQSSSLSATVQSNMLECARVLDQIHQTLAHEQLHRELLERKVFDLQAELVQSHVQLLGTQAGERRARALALHDSLTTLPNRNFFLQRLGHALALVAPQRGALAVLYLDLDGFKPINDIHGHAAGDELLRIVAARLKRAVREEDMVSRIGGDEFACLVAGSPSREQLSELARKLLDTVSADCKIGQTRLNVSLSIGIAICPDDGATAETMLTHWVRCAVDQLCGLTPKLWGGAAVRHERPVNALARTANAWGCEHCEQRQGYEPDHFAPYRKPRMETGATRFA